MWTSKNRARYDRSKLRYPSDLTDNEWQLVERLIPPGKRGGDKRTVVMREVVNGLMYVLSTGCQWRAIPKDLPPKSTVHDYFDLWTYDGTLKRMHHALYEQCREQEQRKASPTAAIIDSQSVKAQKKGGLHRPAWLRCGQKDQGQEAPYSRRHIRPPAPRRRPSGRYPGSRRGRSGYGNIVWDVSVLEDALRRWRISRTEIRHRTGKSSSASRRSNRQAFRHRNRFQDRTQTMDRRTHHRVAQSLPTTCQRLGKSGSRAGPCPRRNRCCADRSERDRPSAASSVLDRALGTAPIR